MERTVDPSGVTVVRGRGLRLDPFPAAGPGKNVKLTDVVTGADRSPMSAGFMAWRREDSFAWTLDYDEVDLVLEGTLEITVGDRKVRAGEGDVVFIPKGSAIVFGTPHRVRIFYVTYPAAWAK